MANFKRYNSIYEYIFIITFSFFTLKMIKSYPDYGFIILFIYLCIPVCIYVIFHLIFTKKEHDIFTKKEHDIFSANEMKSLLLAFQNFQNSDIDKLALDKKISQLTRLQYETLMANYKTYKSTTENKASFIDFLMSEYKVENKANFNPITVPKSATNDRAKAYFEKLNQHKEL